MVRKPEEERRWFRVSGKESPIQLRVAWPERLSKGRTRTTRPVDGAEDCAKTGKTQRRRARKSQ